MEKKIKKVGLMTWYSYHNYGTSLQAVALYLKIKELGYQPVLVNYQPKPELDAFSLKPSAIYKKVQSKLKTRRLCVSDPPERAEQFDTFLKNMTTETRPCNTLPELNALNAQIDAFVCGSDQIWAPTCFDEKYFLSFVQDTDKMVAYAPSIGLPSIQDANVQEKMKQLISRFQYLSVRETQGAELIKKLCGKSAEIVLDPTLLFSAVQWREILSKCVQPQMKLPDKYILCYFLGDDRNYSEAVQKLAKASNLPVYVIPVFEKQRNLKECIPFEVGPAAFVSLIDHASYVCTDSLHGMAFSVNFNIPFVVFERFEKKDPKNQNSRIYNLLEMCGLKERLQNKNHFSAKKAVEKCDFTHANMALEQKRAVSLAYLENALQCATKEKAAAVGSLSVVTELCCGCGACVAVCPKAAIEIQLNENGFQHYMIDTERCVNCGMCREVCPFSAVDAQPLKNGKGLYSYKSIHKGTSRKSSSGGIGYDLAVTLSRKGDWVCGSAYQREQDAAEHILILPNQLERLPLLQGSKYLQSVSAKAICKIAELPRGEKFVFFGTPCQVAGLDKLLRVQNRRDDAILVDLICHGVPSRLIWQKYLAEIEQRYQIAQHPTVQFRAENNAWRDMYMYVTDGKHTYTKSEKSDGFYTFFRNGLCYACTCYECPYRERSAADIRIGDFWGNRFIKDKDGVSMVLVNTEQGKTAFNKLDGISEQYPLTEYWSVQYPYNNSQPLMYSQLMNDLRQPNTAFAEINKKYGKPYVIKERVQTIKKYVKKILGEHKNEMLGRK